MNYSIDSNGYYGEFGGAYIPEILHRCVSQLQEACRTILPSDDFKREFEDLLKHYVGRPSPPPITPNACPRNMVARSTSSAKT